MPDRAGVLGRGLPIVANTHSSSTRAVHRGLLVYKRVLCRQPGTPPAGAADVIASFVRDPSWTDREYITHLTLDQPTCAACHGQFNGLGFAFEGIDALGRPEAGPSDATGHLDDMDFDGLDTLGGVLAGEEVETCVARHWLAFALGRNTEPADRQSMDDAMREIGTSTGDLDLLELITRITLSQAFRTRRVDG
jgi:hypothetical protein